MLLVVRAQDESIESVRIYNNRRTMLSMGFVTKQNDDESQSGVNEVLGRFASLRIYNQDFLFQGYPGAYVAAVAKVPGFFYHGFKENLVRYPVGLIPFSVHIQDEDFPVLDIVGADG